MNQIGALRFKFKTKILVPFIIIMETKVGPNFDSAEFLKLSIEPYFQRKFTELLNQKKNEQTKASLE